jgi:hypothetical protein
MSTEPVSQSITGEPAEVSLFDRLARFVPEERQTEYYRVLAHTRTLRPDDELLRILEAMGVLALVTCETPAAVADERVRLQELLASVLEQTEAAQEHMLNYVRVIDSRLSGLPRELESGLDPARIAKLLGESLRQHFLKSGLPDTAQSLRSTVTDLVSAQRQLSEACKRMVNVSETMTSQVDSTNIHVIRSVETTAGIIGDLLNELARHVVRIWLPIVAAAAFALGCIAGIKFESWRSCPVPPQFVAQPSSPSVDPTPVPFVGAQKAGKQHDR